MRISNDQSRTWDRGVSDTVGFVLVFGLITVVIAVVLVGGLAGLENAQQAEQANNVERAFDVLDANVADVHRDGAPSRSTEMRLAGGQLGFGDPTTVRVNNETEFESRPLVYSNGDTEIVYELGGIIRTDSGRSVMLNEPEYTLHDRRSSVPLLIATKPSDQTTTSGHQTVLVRTSYQRTESLHPQTSENEAVTIAIDSPRVDAWERYFERQVENHEGGSVERTDDTTVQYTIDGGETSVSATWIRFRFV